MDFRKMKMISFGNGLDLRDNERAKKDRKWNHILRRMEKRETEKEIKRQLGDECDGST